MTWRCCCAGAFEQRFDSLSICGRCSWSGGVGTHAIRSFPYKLEQLQAIVVDSNCKRGTGVNVVNSCPQRSRVFVREPSSYRGVTLAPRVDGPAVADNLAESRQDGSKKKHAGWLGDV